jgi:hypothetical protein
VLEIAFQTGAKKRFDGSETLSVIDVRDQETGCRVRSIELQQKRSGTLDWGMCL